MFNAQSTQYHQQPSTLVVAPFTCVVLPYVDVVVISSAGLVDYVFGKWKLLRQLSSVSWTYTTGFLWWRNSCGIKHYIVLWSGWGADSHVLFVHPNSNHIQFDILYHLKECLLLFGLGLLSECGWWVRWRWTSCSFIGKSASPVHVIFLWGMKLAGWWCWWTSLLSSSLLSCRAHTWQRI